jgi:fatty acid desaturase
MISKEVNNNRLSECLPDVRQHNSVQSSRTGNAELDQATLRTVAPVVFVAKLAALGFLLACFGYGVIMSHGFTRLALQICLGAIFAHATELVHQCLHRTATGRASWDHSFGMVLATPLGISFWRYLADHFRHHKDVTMESFSYNYQRMESSSRRTRFAGFLRHLSMLDHYLGTLRWIGLTVIGRFEERFERVGPLPNKTVVRRIRQDYLVMAILLSLAILLSIVLRTDILIQLWLIPMVFGWAPVHALIELPEHWKCDTSSTDARLNTRSIRASRFARWYVNNNCNHVGHHHDISVAMEKLPVYETRLMAERPFRHFEESYPRFYFRFVCFLYSGKY